MTEPMTPPPPTAEQELALRDWCTRMGAHNDITRKLRDLFATIDHERRRADEAEATKFMWRDDCLEADRKLSTTMAECARLREVLTKYIIGMQTGSHYCRYCLASWHPQKGEPYHKETCILSATPAPKRDTQRTPGFVERCNHRYEDGGFYNIKCDRGPGNADLCEVVDCPHRAITRATPAEGT